MSEVDADAITAQQSARGDSLSRYALIAAVVVGVVFLYAPLRILHYSSGATEWQPGFTRFSTVFACHHLRGVFEYLHRPDEWKSLLKLSSSFLIGAARESALLLGYIGISQLPILTLRGWIPRWIRQTTIVIFVASAAFSIHDAISTPPDNWTGLNHTVTRGIAFILEPLLFLLAAAALVMRERDVTVAPQLTRTARSTL
jgi:hypothetical protein